MFSVSGSILLRLRAYDIHYLTRETETTDFRVHRLQLQATPVSTAAATAPTMAETVDFVSSDAAAWRAALAAYDRRLASLGKPDLVDVDSFYRHDLPALLRRRDPDPFLAKPELVRLLQWKLSRGKWRSVGLILFLAASFPASWYLSLEVLVPNPRA